VGFVSTRQLSPDPNICNRDRRPGAPSVCRQRSIPDLPTDEEPIMLNLFRTISDRLKALFVADVALEFEALLLARQADRTAELLVQAEQHERHGFPTVAAQLRAGAEALSLGRPLAGVLPALEHWQVADDTVTTAMTPTDDHPRTNGTGGKGRGTKLPAARGMGT
jgi:hypothetical protein